MLLSPKQFIAFVDGRGPDSILLAKTPTDLSSYIRARTNRVFIGREYALKLIKRHGLKYEHFAMVQDAIDRGWCGIHRQKDRNDLAFVYIDDAQYRRPFKLIIKTPSSEDEMWIKTLHKMQPSQTDGFLQKLEILRNHDGWNDEGAS